MFETFTIAKNKKDLETYIFSFEFLSLEIRICFDQFY